MTTYGLLTALLLAQAAPPPAQPAEGAAPEGPLAAPRSSAISVPPRQSPPQPRSLPAPQGPVLSLDDALRETQAKNLDLRVAQARLDQSRELHWKAWSAFLPQVIAGATLTHNNLPDVTFPLPTGYAIRDLGAPGAEQATPGLPGAATNLALVPTAVDEVIIQKQNTLGAQIQLTQPLFAPGAWYGIAASRAAERLAADNTEGARRDIVFGTAQAYYGAAGMKQVVLVQERQLAIAQDHERDARVRYEAGSTPKVTLLRAEIDRARAEQDLKRAQNSYLSAKISLATLLDRKAAEFEVAVPPSPELPRDDGALEDAAARDRPDVQAAGEALTVAQRNRAGVYTRYLPTLGAFGRAQYANTTGFSGQTTTWAVGLALNWTLLDGFVRESDLRETSARVREAEALQLGALSRARDEVRRGRLDLDSAVANREKAKEQLALARENQRLVDVNYRAGAATYLEVSDANTTLLAAELTQVSESLNADLSSLRLLKAAGAFNPR